MYHVYSSRISNTTASDGAYSSRCDSIDTSPMCLEEMKGPKHFFTLIGVAIMLFCCFGCSSEEEASVEPDPSMIADTEADETVEVSAVLPLADTVVLENMYTTEAERLADETPVQIVTVLQGSERVTIEARFRGVRDFGFGFPIYECELMSEEVERMGGIAAGMSGSPVGPPGRVIGALAYGDNFSKAPTRFWVTAIDAMESGLTHQTFDEALAEKLAGAPALGSPLATYAPVKTPMNDDVHLSLFISVVTPI